MICSRISSVFPRLMLIDMLEPPISPMNDNSGRIHEGLGLVFDGFQASTSAWVDQDP